MEPSLRPKMTTHCTSVSLLQYWSCMQLLLINTLPHSSRVCKVLRLNVSLFSQQHTLCLWSQTWFFSDSVNPLYFPNYLSSQGCHNSFSSQACVVFHWSWFGFVLCTWWSAYDLFLLFLELVSRTQPSSSSTNISLYHPCGWHCNSICFHARCNSQVLFVGK